MTASTHALGALVRLGIAERWETWLEVAWFSVDGGRGGGVGPGDADLGFKVLLRDEDRSRIPAAAVLVSSSVPIGDDEIGERGWQPEARLLLGWQLDPTWSLAVNGWRAAPRRGRALRSGARERPRPRARPGIAAVAEIYAVTPADAEGRDAAYAHGGLELLLGDRGQPRPPCRSGS